MDIATYRFDEYINSRKDWIFTQTKNSKNEKIQESRGKKELLNQENKNGMQNTCIDTW